MSDEEVTYTCCKCNKDIETTVITAIGRHYHLECFLCTGCNNPLSTRRYKQKEGMPYCSLNCKAEPPKLCGKCNKLVEGSTMKALGAVFHPNCFTCKTCGTGVAVKTFFEVGDGVFCAICYKKELDIAFEECANDVKIVRN